METKETKMVVFLGVEDGREVDPTDFKADYPVVTTFEFEAYTGPQKMALIGAWIDRLRHLYVEVRETEMGGVWEAEMIEADE